MNSTNSCHAPTVHNKRVSDPPSSPSISRPTSPSSTPILLSSTSSTSSRIMETNATDTKNVRVRKSDRKWLCAKCQGDVRRPQAVKTQSEASKTSDDEIEQDDESLHEALGMTYVICASKSCPTPKYHLTCSGVPKGSQIFRNAIVSCQTAADEAVASNSSSNKYDAKQILERLYPSSEDVWWDLAADTNILIDGKKRTQQSLRSDKNWPTSMISFTCSNCDVEGTSRFLLEYFERFHSMKTSFYAEYLGGSNNATGCRRDRADESAEARTGEAFFWHLMKDNRKDYLRRRRADGETICGELDWKSSEIQLKSMSKVLTFLSKQLQQQQQRRQKRQKNKFQLDSSYLVGMPIRLFNPIDNSYHSGRVIDYKTNAPYKVDHPVSNLKSSAPSDSSTPDIGQLTDGKICRTLYLIRFRHGVEGRKTAVHEWIYLEEHAITIGGEICWANVGNHSGDQVDSTNEKENNDGKPKSSDSGTQHVTKLDFRLQAQKGEYVCPYRPVQIIFRSMLEMIPVQNLNPLISCLESKSCTNAMGEVNPCLNVLAKGFGQAFNHVRLSLSDSGTKIVKESKFAAKEAKGNGKKTAVEPARPVAIPLTPSNPSWIDRILHRAQLSDEDVALGLASACMEKEEERRVRARRHLSVCHIFQPSPTKRNYEVTGFATSASSTESKKPRTEHSIPSINFLSAPNMTDLNHDISLEVAAPLGYSKCADEIETGTNKHRSHDENCPLNKNFYLVPLEVAASHGCAKCEKECETGKKCHKGHDENCPRRTVCTCDPLNGDDVKSISTQVRNTADNKTSPCLKCGPYLDNSLTQADEEKVASSMSPQFSSAYKQHERRLRALTGELDPRPCIGCKWCGPKIEGKGKICQACQLLKNEGWSFKEYIQAKKKCFFNAKNGMKLWSVRDFLQETTVLVGKKITGNAPN